MSSKGSNYEQSFASGINDSGYFSRGSSGSDGRFRRSRGSSSDESSSILWDGFVDEDLRAGGPYLCSIPCDTRPVPPEHALYNRITHRATDLITAIYEILSQAGIENVFVTFCVKNSMYQPEDRPILTCHVDAKRTTRDISWIAAARKICQHLWANGITGINVEIADPIVFKPLVLGAVETTEPIFFQWDKISKEIRAKCNIFEWTTLGCCRVGTNENPRMNPVTVLVTVLPESQSDWTDAREKIVSILDEHSLANVAVRIVRDRVIRGGSVHEQRVHMPVSCLEGPGKVGMSLGIRGYPLTNGTLGGWIEIRKEGWDNWFKFVLTCSHCVIPPEEDTPPEKKDLYNLWRKEGFQFPSFEASKLHIDAPSVRDFELNLARLRQQNEELAAESTFKQAEAALKAEGYCAPTLYRLYKANMNAISLNKDSISRMENFMGSNSHHLGAVRACSGEKVIPRTKDSNMVADWSIVDPLTKRLGNNEVLKVATQGGYKEPFLSGCKFKGTYTPNQTCSIGSEIYKCGARTGETSGRYSGLMTAHISTKMVDNKKVPFQTEEHTIFGEFSARGDFGSLVFDKGHTVIGMIFGGDERTNRSYFTRIDDIFAEIKKLPQVGDVRLFVD